MALADHAAPVPDAENPLLAFLSVKDGRVVSNRSASRMLRDLRRLHWSCPNERFAHMAQRVVEAVCTHLVQDAVTESRGAVVWRLRAALPRTSRPTVASATCPMSTMCTSSLIWETGGFRLARPSPRGPRSAPPRGSPSIRESWVPVPGGRPRDSPSAKRTLYGAVDNPASDVAGRLARGQKSSAGF